MLCADKEETVTDIGEWYNASKSSDQFCGFLPTLTSAQKHIVCLNITKSLAEIVFPETYLGVAPGKAIKDCDRDNFLNIFGLLHIACTIPVTSCVCERSASCVLHQLIDCMWAFIEKHHLSNLALLHIHYNTPIDLDNQILLHTTPSKQACIWVTVSLTWTLYTAR